MLLIILMALSFNLIPAAAKEDFEDYAVLLKSPILAKEIQDSLDKNLLPETIIELLQGHKFYYWDKDITKNILKDFFKKNSKYINLKGRNGFPVVDIVLQSQLPQEEKIENVLILIQNNPHISPEQLIKYIKYLNDKQQLCKIDLASYALKENEAFEALYNLAEETIKKIKEIKDKLNKINGINMKEIEENNNKSNDDCVIA